MLVRSRGLKAVAAGVISILSATAPCAWAQADGAVAAQAPTAADAASAPAAAPVSLSNNAVEAASAFRAYEKKAASLSPSFTSGPQVEDELAIASGYEPKQLARGAVAYAALVALQDPAFVSAMRIYAADPDQARSLAGRIEQDPRYVTQFNGAASAAGLIVATLASDNGRMQTTGAAVKQAAYSVQHSAWSKSKVIDPTGRLARTKTLSAALMTPVPEDVTLLKASEGVGQDGRAAQMLGVHGQPVDGPYAPVVMRGLAVAAVAILGHAGDDEDSAIETLMSEPENAACLNMSKLNLYQCLAVAGPWYEDVFCLGEHALGETAQCLTKETASASQIQAAVTPVSSNATATAPSPQSLAAPTAPVAYAAAR